jgi:hypothetical protein
MSKRREPDRKHGPLDDYFRGPRPTAKSPKFSCSNSSTACAGTSSYQDTYMQFKSVPYNNIFTAQDVPSDGTCFYSALAHQLQRPLDVSQDIQREIVAFIESNADLVVCNNVA